MWDSISSSYVFIRSMGVASWVGHPIAFSSNWYRNLGDYHICCHKLVYLLHASIFRLWPHQILQLQQWTKAWFFVHSLYPSILKLIIDACHIRTIRLSYIWNFCPSSHQQTYILKPEMCQNNIVVGMFRSLKLEYRLYNMRWIDVTRDIVFLCFRFRSFRTNDVVIIFVHMLCGMFANATTEGMVYVQGVGQVALIQLC